MMMIVAAAAAAAAVVVAAAAAVVAAAVVSANAGYHHISGLVCCFCCIASTHPCTENGLDESSVCRLLPSLLHLPYLSLVLLDHEPSTCSGAPLQVEGSWSKSTSER